MKTKRLALLLSATFFLCSCQSNSQPSSSYQDPYSSTYTPQSSSSRSTSSSRSSSSQAPVVTPKQTVINYLKANGIRSGTMYAITGSSPWGNNYTVTDTIWYDTSDDTFSSTVSLDYSSSSGSIANFAGFTFTWGNLRSANFLGSTTYKVTTSTRKNSFSFTVQFSTYPDFSVKSYQSLSIGYSSTVSDDAALDAVCLGRAINNCVNSFPSMGYSGSLW